MTAQIAEKLRYGGEDVAMCTNPLSDYFAMGGVNPRFESNCTALWRGYVGRWEIIDGRLYLVELHGTLESGDEASVATIFPISRTEFSPTGTPARSASHRASSSNTFTWATAAPSSETCF